MSKYLGGKQASELLGVHQRTLYQWEEKGWIKTIRTKGGKRLYDVGNYLANKNKESQDNNKISVCYVRVSSLSQKDDLERQIKYMQKKYPSHTIIKDISSGINLNRKGLNKILDLAIEGKLCEVVVAHKDRLARFGYELIERIIEKYSKGKIVIINKKENKEPQEELIEDVMDVMNVFIARRYGMRKYKLKK
ncbi:putative resolvase [Cotonvirus japonicus]|uniref:Resolvase n=1 Tax=Cotonvirus japonicus TaxID=2811091 RepID=A0ABM7NUD8_9VIRU|nr:putative resolvase [Cotonvirus japonicus]BCS83716.1 putative resolvase [Cotonvirus japonicus]